MNPKERWNQCYYLSSTSNIKEQYLDCIGFLQHVTPGKIDRDGMYTRHLEAGRPWAFDNSAFTGKFCFDTWTNKLKAFLPYLQTCLFVVVPDVVGDSVQTIRQFKEYAPLVRPLGYPLAFVSQDGLTPEHTPWDQLDTLFVGGTDQHKLGREAGILIDEGIKRGKWIHIGRVNSPKRIRQFWRADSWDGTHLSFAPDKHTPAIAAAVREVRAWKQVRRLF